MSLLFKATLFFGFSSIVGIIAQTIKGKVTAVILGPEGVGLMTQLTLLFSFAVTISGLGLQQGIIRYTSEYSTVGKDEKLNGLHSTFMTVLTVFSCLFTVVGILASHQISFFLFETNKYVLHIQFIFLAIPCSVIANYYQTLLSGFKAIESKTKLLIISNITSLPISIALIYNYQLYGAIISLVTAQVILLILGIIYTNNVSVFNLKFKPKLFDWHFIKINSTYGIVGMLMVLMGVATTFSITNIITTKLGIKSTGYFSVTWQISTIYIGMIFSSISTYYYPMLCEINNKDITLEVNKAIRHFVKLVTPAVILLISFNNPLIQLLFSSDFLASGELLAYFLPGDFFRIIFETIALVFLAKGKLLLYALLYTLWCISYISGVFVGIPLFGIIAVSYSYTATYACILLITYWAIKNTYSFIFERETKVIIFYSILSIAVSSLVTLNLETKVSYLVGLTLLFIYSGKDINHITVLLCNKVRK